MFRKFLYLIDVTTVITVTTDIAVTMVTKITNVPDITTVTTDITPTTLITATTDKGLFINDCMLFSGGSVSPSPASLFWLTPLPLLLHYVI